MAIYMLLKQFKGKGHTEYLNDDGGTDAQATLGAEGGEGGGSEALGGEGGGGDGGDAGGGEGSGEEAGGEGEGNKDKGQGEADNGEHWSDAIEALKGKDFAKKFDSPEDMVEAMEKLAAKAEADGEIVTDSADIKINVPEGVTDDNPLLGALKDYMVESGMGVKAGQNLADAYVKAEVEIGNQMHKDCQETLDSVWGNDKDNHLQTCNETIAFIDGHIPGFGKFVTSNPNVGSDPVFCQFMYWHSKAIGEDSAPAGPGGGNPNKEMSTTDFLKSEVFGGSGD